MNCNAEFVLTSEMKEENEEKGENNMNNEFLYHTEKYRSDEFMYQNYDKWPKDKEKRYEKALKIFMQNIIYNTYHFNLYFNYQDLHLETGSLKEKLSDKEKNILKKLIEKTLYNLFLLLDGEIPYPEGLFIDQKEKLSVKLFFELLIIKNSKKWTKREHWNKEELIVETIQITPSSYGDKLTAIFKDALKNGYYWTDKKFSDLLIKLRENNQTFQAIPNTHYNCEPYSKWEKRKDYKEALNILGRQLMYNVIKAGEESLLENLNEEKSIYFDWIQHRCLSYFIRLIGRQEFLTLEYKNEKYIHLFLPRLVIYEKNSGKTIEEFRLDPSSPYLEELTGIYNGQWVTYDFYGN